MRSNHAVMKQIKMDYMHFCCITGKNTRLNNLLKRRSTKNFLPFTSGMNTLKRCVVRKTVLWLTLLKLEDVLDIKLIDPTPANNPQPPQGT